MSKVIEVNALVKKYGNVTAVDGASFEVSKGEVFSLVGPNGSGKTTTVEILECLRKPTSGTAKVLGFDIATQESRIKERIGVMPQEFNTFDRLTVKENVQLVADIHRSKTGLRPLLEDLGLWDLRTRRFAKLSGGQKRRVGIAMSLVSDPEIVFLDEPTTGLDLISRHETWGFIRQLRKYGKTVFLTTHYMEEVERLADRVGIIVRGKILGTGTVKELIEAHGKGTRLVVTDGSERVKEILGRQADRCFSDETNRLVGTFLSKKTSVRALSDIYDADENCKVEMVESSMEDVLIGIAGVRINESGDISGCSK